MAGTGISAAIALRLVALQQPGVQRYGGNLGAWGSVPVELHREVQVNRTGAAHVAGRAHPTQNLPLPDSLSLTNEEPVPKMDVRRRESGAIVVDEHEIAVLVIEARLRHGAICRSKNRHVSSVCCVSA